MIITTSTSQVTSHRPTHADPANDDEMDEHIQHLYAAHEPGAARFESDRELLNAVERKVSETIAKLDAGEDYEQTPLTEAIIRRHLEKQRRIEAEVAASSEQLQSHLGMSQHVLLSPEQRKLLAVAGYMDDFLPHLHNVGPKTWFPMGELRFDSDDDDDERRNSSEGDGQGEDELTFERPASTNAPGGIKPYRPAVPPPGSSTTSSHLHEDPPPPHTTVIGVAGAPSAPQNPQNLQAICRAMLWKGYRTGKPFAKCSIIIPLVLSIIVAAIFNYAGGPVCGGLCSCDVSEHALYVFTYGLAVRVLPTSVVFAYILHIMVYAHHRVLLEQGEAEAGNGTAGARVLMSLSSRRNSRRKSSTTKGAASAQLVKLATTAAAFVKGAKEHVSAKSSPEDEKALRRDAIEALRSPTGTRPNNAGGAASPARGASLVTSDQDCSVPWDVPSLKFCAQQRTFIAFTTVTTLLMSLTQFASAVGFPDLTIVPVEAAALFLPTVGFCFVLRVPKAVWPMIALEAFPFVAYFAEPSLGMPRKVFQILWPFLVVVTERLFFYAFAAVSLPSFPIGARVAATTMITFTSHVLILTNSMFVPREVGPLIGIGMQVLLYELLLGTLVLDRIWMVLKAQWQFRVRGMKPQLPQLAASDLRCIGTQTRWVSLLMAMFSVIPVRIWRVWPRAVKGGLSCHDGSIREGQFYPESLGVVVGCFLIAAVITGLIRRCNDCLRAPLMVRGVGFPITIGLYLFSTATLGLAAGAYGVIWPAGM
ncbi:transmembrane protein, putative [Bodo saltans]|uniref:Transmembrane protein, putative n=1 Tax=Bodo saltans TaxID=75058 RepID=A0A0S4KGA9_BODSA|nr:transmembrane protein, putative [Bodo saltans]|eukprot:CUI14164.1 transmembrane protein, putative [Bodo saltans]